MINLIAFNVGYVTKQTHYGLSFFKVCLLCSKRPIADAVCAFDTLNVGLHDVC